MRIDPALVGHMIAVQFARPVYMYEYGAHVRLNGQSKEHLMAQPIMTPDCTQEQAKAALATGVMPPMKQMARDVLVGVLVSAVTEDSVTFDCLTPAPDGQSMMMVRKTVPSTIVVSIDEVVDHDMPLPAATRQVRAPAAAPPVPLADSLPRVIL